MPIVSLKLAENKSARFWVTSAMAVLGLVASQTHASDSTPSLDWAGLAASTSRAVVLIKTDGKNGPLGQGTGFIVDSSGIIVTCFHVVDQANAISIKTEDGEIYDVAEVTGVDQRRDLALLRISGHGLPALSLGESATIPPGTAIMVVSNPLGLERSISTGVVSGLRDTGSGYKVLQLTAPISPGSSGAPVIDPNGFVIGVISFKATEGESLNFGIPANYVKGLIENPKSLSIETLSQVSETPKNPFDSQPLRRVTNIADVRKLVLIKETVPGAEDPRGVGPICMLALETELALHGFQVVSTRSDADAELAVTASYSYLTFGPIWALGRITLSFNAVLRPLGTREALFGYADETGGKPATACQRAAKEIVRRLADARAEGLVAPAPPK